MKLYKAFLFPALATAAPVDNGSQEKADDVSLITTVTTSYVMGTSLYSYTYTAGISTDVPVQEVTTDVVVTGEAAMASASESVKSDFKFPETVTNDGGKDYTIQLQSTQLDVPAPTADYTFSAKESEISVPEHYTDVTVDGLEVHLTVPAFNTTVHLDEQVVQASFTTTSSQRVVFTSVPFQDSDSAVKYFDLTLTVGLRQPAAIVTASPVTVPVTIPAATVPGIYSILSTRTVSAVTVSTFYEVPGTITVSGGSTLMASSTETPQETTSETPKSSESPSESPSTTASPTPTPTTSEERVSSTESRAEPTTSEERVSSTESRAEPTTRATIEIQTKNAAFKNVAAMGSGFFGFLGLLLM